MSKIIALAEMPPVTNEDIVKEARRAAVAAYNRVMGWANHPTYDTKTAVLQEVREAIAMVYMAGRLIGGGIWDSEHVLAWASIDTGLLHTLEYTVATAKRASEVRNVPCPVLPR